jgi:Asp-tRNA(Asn)/Glu-tRNA(Gln) amidotransferase C subunit
MLDSWELKRLQKLACIKLSEEEEKKLWSQLQNIVSFLWKLQDITLTSQSTRPAKDVAVSSDISINPIAWVEQYHDVDSLLANVKHQKINKSIVIKSVLH